MEDSGILEIMLADNIVASLEQSQFPYLEAIGSLMYFMLATRPTLALMLAT